MDDCNVKTRATGKTNYALRSALLPALQREFFSECVDRRTVITAGILMHTINVNNKYEVELRVRSSCGTTSSGENSSSNGYNEGPAGVATVRRCRRPHPFQYHHRTDRIRPCRTRNISGCIEVFFYSRSIQRTACCVGITCAQ